MQDLLRDPRLRAQLEGGIQFLVAAFVFTVALASSQLDYVNIPIARPARWAVLAELAAFALAYALTRPRRRTRVDACAVCAAALVAAAFVSVAWSSDPRLTAGRSVTLLALFATTAAIGYGAAGSAAAVGRVLLGVLVGVTAVAVAGILVYVFNSGRAIVPATTQSPVRYTGLGGNPNSAAMLMAIGIPLALWALFETRSRVGRALLVGVLLLLDGSLVASGSRGPLVACFVGVLVYMTASGRGRRWKLAAAAVAAAILLVDTAVTQLPQPADQNPVLTKRFRTGAVPRGPRDAEFLLPLESEVGYPRPGSTPFHRTLLNSSGRVPAWRGALEQVEERPLLGYGFGTEERVFVDRYYLFLSSLVENSYLGTLLQLGVVGLILLLALLALVLVRGVHDLLRLRGDRRHAAAACAAVFACGVVVAATQSFATSVGSTLTVAFWLCGFLLAGATSR